jgi:transposase
VDGLRNGHRTGRPARADAKLQGPAEHGAEAGPARPWAFTIWTIDRLRVYLSEQTGILLNYSRFRALLTREDYRLKEPKHDLSHLQDRPAQETIEQVTAWLKKHPAPPRRRNRAVLDGRNDGEPAPAAAALLDETRRAQAHSSTGNAAAPAFYLARTTGVIFA